MPGISAVHCQQPMVSASIMVRLASGRWLCPRSFSPASSSTALTIRNTAATTGVPNRPRTNFSSRKPTITAGMVAITISRNTRRLSLI